MLSPFLYHADYERAEHPEERDLKRDKVEAEKSEHGANSAKLSKLSCENCKGKSNIVS